jgi:hypothetical protein
MHGLIYEGNKNRKPSNEIHPHERSRSLQEPAISEMGVVIKGNWVVKHS